jgi:thioredoxin 1
MTTDGLRSVNDLSFDDEVLRASVPVVVDFTAAWCAPCRALKPILRELAQEQAGALEVVTVDGDESPSIAQRYGVRGFPTLLVFMGGREVARNIGLTNKRGLLKLLEAARAAAAA